MMPENKFSNHTSSEFENASPAAAEPLKISDDDSPWKIMDVGSLQDFSLLNFGKQRLSKIAAAVVLLLIAVLFLSRRNVAPLKGNAPLAAAEFRDVRPARPGESVLLTGGLGSSGRTWSSCCCTAASG